MTRKTLYAFIVSFILLIAVIILNGYAFNKMQFYSDRVDHTRVVITTFEEISDNFKSALVYTPSYLDLPEKEFYLNYKKDADSIPAELKELKILTTDNSIQFRRVDTLEKLISSQFDVVTKMNIAEMIKAGKSNRLATFLQIHNIIDRAINEENSLLMQRKSELAKTIRLINILTTIFAILAVGIILLTFLTNMFVTRRRKWLEGFLESILNTSKNGVVYYKAIRERGKIEDFRIDYLNIAVKELLGIEPSTVLGKRLKEIPSFIRQTNLIDRFVEVVETGKLQEFEAHYITEATDRWFFISLMKLEDGLTTTFHNISQLKNYEQDLKNNIQELESSNNELEQYAYVASHDLQEPLRKIRSFGSYLQDTQNEKLDDRGKMHLEKIMSAAERMSTLIKDILSFSSMKRRHEYLSTDLNVIVDGVLQDLDLLINQRNAVVKKDNLPTIEAIPLQMTQLFYNLLNNSLKFIKENRQPQITLTSRKLSDSETQQLELDKNKTYFEIVVHDNGIGFSEEYKEQIFGLFKRLNERHFYPGSGIGLALCRKVVNNHNGIIYAESKEGDGASFYIVLPEKQ
jgi:Bacteriophytochrome (light-regulated signal transduction histidine kinase)